MSSKSSLNDYSALGNLFRDGMLGVLISTGVLSTLVPNLIESLGKVKELSSFYTLNLFSVIYFIFPITIFSTYWLIRGSRLFFVEKLNTYESMTWAQANREKKIYVNEWYKFFIALAKLVPIILFVYDESIFADTQGLLFYYFAVCGLQLFGNGVINEKWVRLVIECDDNRERLLYRAFCVDALVFFLDFIIGVALVVFSTPWIIYKDSFYGITVLLIVGYALISWIFSMYRFHVSRLNISDFIVCILLSTAGLCFPAINMGWYACSIISTLVFFLIIGVYWILTMSIEVDKGKTITDVKENKRKSLKLLVQSIFILAIAGLVVHFLVYKGNEKSNLTYLKNRFQASQLISNKEVLPFDYQEDAMKIHFQNMFYESYTNDIVAQKLNCCKVNVKFHNLRSRYYPVYDTLQKKLVKSISPIYSYNDQIDDIYSTQSKIDEFYSDTFYAIDTTHLAKHRAWAKLQPLSQRRKLERYLHPVDYTASLLDRQNALKKNSEDMLKTSEDLLRLSLLKKNSQYKEASIFDITEPVEKKLQKRLDSLYRTSVDLRFDKTFVKPELDSAQLARIVRFHKIYFEYREVQYIRAYEAAQKIYRSYLVDSQRIGVWAFLVTVLTLALAAYFNGFGNGSFKLSGDRDSNLPIDAPRHSLPIMLLAIIILLLPLMKPIEPEHIDPEKPYWMVSLQNWHTPSFFKALTDRDQDRFHYRPGGGAEVNVDMDQLRKSVDQLAIELQENRAAFSRIEHELDTIGREADTVATMLQDMRGLKKQSDDVRDRPRPKRYGE